MDASAVPPPATWVRAYFSHLKGKYALYARHFAKLLGVDSCTSDEIFHAIFDTDANGLVDAFEAM